MGAFLEQDRPLLKRACELARDARHPPRKLGLRVEPIWAALLALDGREVSSAVFAPGDTQDAVKRLHTPTDAGDLTLYLTLEPKAGFDRLPPVTESIRHLGVKRVVVGALDPAQRYRGEGSGTLERLGIDVVLADGEEARFAQQILEDYSRWLQRGLAVLRARVELRAIPEGDYDLSLDHEKGRERPGADAVIFAAGSLVQAGNAWSVVIDPQGWERPSERKIVYQPREMAIAGTRPLPYRNGQLDLGALLRDLALLGILSVELRGDASLFRQALSSGLIESVVAQFPEPGEGLHALSRMDRVRLSEGGDPLDLRLGDARLLDEQSLEAHVELC